MSKRLSLVAVLAAMSLTSVACVDSFGGSNITITFDEGVQTPTPEGATVENGRPPPKTHFSIYAVDFVRATDGSGDIVNSYAFKVKDFEIVPLINTQSPCFLELENERYPGLHSMQELSKIRLDTGIINENDPSDARNPAGLPTTDYIDVIGARERHNKFAAIQNTVKATVEFSPEEPPGVHPDFPVAPAMQCPPTDPNAIPDPGCIDDVSNAQRLAVCKSYWDRFPNAWEGNDRIYTLPLNGVWRGSVKGINPKNGGFVGGSNFFVDLSLESFDALVINWQYEDRNGDGEPDYPAGTTDEQKSNIGFHYMAGTPKTGSTRGTINVRMVNRTFNLISADATIFPNLDNDNVNF